MATCCVSFLSVSVFYELSLRCYETNARRTRHIALGPTDVPHTRRTPAAPAPAPPRPRERGVTVWDYEPEYVESWLNNAGYKRGCPAHKSGSRVTVCSGPFFRFDDPSGGKPSFGRLALCTKRQDVGNASRRIVRPNSLGLALLINRGSSHLRAAATRASAPPWLPRAGEWQRLRSGGNPSSS